MDVELVDGITLDVSHWDYDTFDAECMANSGVKNLIIGTIYSNTADDMIYRAKRAGINVMGLYVFLYFGNGDHLARTDRAIVLAKKHGVPVIWLDVEADAEGTHLTPQDRINELDACVKRVQVAGLKAGIYTGSWYWVPKMGNTSRFSHLPLWYSNYGVNDGKRAPIRNIPLRAFGGWTYCVIHQYWSTGGLCGREHRDWNYVWSDAPGLTKEDTMCSTCDDILLALFAGSEEREGDQVKSKEERLRLARYRLEQVAEGNAQSIGDMAASAIALVKQSAHIHRQGSDGEVPPHRHEIGQAIPES